MEDSFQCTFLHGESKRKCAHSGFQIWKLLLRNRLQLADSAADARRLFANLDFARQQIEAILIFLKVGV